MNRRFGVLGLVLALALLPMAAAAQTAQVGQVRVEVKDASNAVLPGATVTLTSEERGVSRTGVTDSNGIYLFNVVTLGRYTVQIKLSSFETKTVTGNLVEEAKTTVVPVSLKIATVEVSTTVTGETPIVDATNQTQETRLRADEFQKMPVGRSYQSLMGVTPGVVGTGNVNAHGALTSNNVFLFDGVNTTDPTTGTFGNNLNFESIQELVVRTGSVSAEFGRGTGAIVDVITRSGTNRYEGSYKYLATNDNWNPQNTTKSEAKNADGSCVCTSLARTKFDHVNPVNSLTGGGPIFKNKTWFFIAFEEAKNTSPQRQTSPAPGFTADNYQQTTSSPFLNLRVTEQLGSNHNVWVKVTRSPTNGFVIDYYAPSPAGEKYSLTGQDQGGTNVSGQYTGVFGAKWTGEVLLAHASSFINVFPYLVGPTLGGSAILDELDGRWYNAATFDGYVKRPRNQATGALSYYTSWMGNPQNVKFGVDWQGFNSENSFKFPTGIEYDVQGFNPVTRTYTPDLRLNYDTDPSKSTGNQIAFFVRDKMQVGARANVEAGLRIEKQSGHSDVDALTVDTTTVSPRISASYAITKDSKTLGVVSYGRFHDAILQGFSDGFAAVPQQTNYDLYVWNGSDYAFDSRSEQGASTFKPNTDVSPRHLDEFTAGVDRQLSAIMGMTVRVIHRSWGNFVDDVRTFNADRSINRVVQNVDGAERTYNGLELSIEKRYSNRWSAAANYTFSKTRGNHFGDDFTALHDFEDAQCRQTAGDTALGNASGIFPCADLQANLTGLPTFDRPHLFKYYGAYTYPSKWFDLTAGVVGSALSKATFSKQRSVQVLLPGTTTASGQTLTYFYEERGSQRIPGMNSTIDLSLEGSYKKIKNSNIGVKFEMFNLFGSETKIAVNNLNWCNSTTSATCATAVNNFGTATARGSFLSPQTYRLTFLYRYNMR